MEKTKTKKTGSEHRSENEQMQAAFGIAWFMADRRGMKFLPTVPRDGVEATSPVRGVGRRLAGGTFEFTYEPRQRAESTLIQKLPHGRLSLTKDGAVQLTLKMPSRGDDGYFIARSLVAEALVARDGMVRWLEEGGHVICGERNKGGEPMLPSC